jgi:hypothetical protein
MCLGSVNMDIIHKVPGYDHIYAYKSFLDEFDRLFKNDKDSLKRYKKSLARRLAMLDTAGITCIDNERFEYIEQDIYSIRFPKSKKNPRFMFTFCLGENNVILLTAFLEQNSSDYESPKRTSRNRIVLIRREFDL